MVSPRWSCGMMLVLCVNGHEFKSCHYENVQIHPQDVPEMHYFLLIFLATTVTIIKAKRCSTMISSFNLDPSWRAKLIWQFKNSFPYSFRVHNLSPFKPFSTSNSHLHTPTLQKLCTSSYFTLYKCAKYNSYSYNIGSKYQIFMGNLTSGSHFVLFSSSEWQCRDGTIAVS